MASAYLGDHGNVSYTRTLTPFGNQCRLGGGGVRTITGSGLTGPRVVLIGGGAGFNGGVIGDAVR